MKHTNEMVNIESNPLNGSSFMNDLRNKYKEKQTAIDWLQDQYYESEGKLTRQDFEKAKKMEKKQTITAVNYGCSDWGSAKDAEQYYKEKFNTNEK